MYQKRRKTEEREKGTSNREFARVTYLFVAIFLAMMGYLVYFNVVTSKDIINSPYNVRLDSMADRVVRGKILDKDGNVVVDKEMSLIDLAAYVGMDVDGLVKGEE